MQGDENDCLELASERKRDMELCRIEGEFEAMELAELAAGRVRRSVQGVKKIMLQPVGKAIDPHSGAQRYTILPANLRMYNYATAVMVSDISDDVLPEPMYRKTARIVLLCDRRTADRASAILHALGAVKVKQR